MRFVQGRLGGKLAAFGAAMLVLAACSHSSYAHFLEGRAEQRVVDGGSHHDRQPRPGARHLEGIHALPPDDRVGGEDPVHRFVRERLAADAGFRSRSISSCGTSGTFGTIKRPDGTTQLTFDGMPLYTYSGDSAAGQANGQGVQGVWFAVTPSGSTSGNGSGSGGGYGSGSGSGGSRGY